MNINLLANVLIYTAGLLWCIELVPQLIKTYKCKDVSGVSLSFFIICSLAYLIYAIGNALLSNWNIIIAHIPSMVMLMIILVVKYRGKHGK